MDKHQFTQEQLQQLSMERTPRGFVWHHDVVPGNMQLVESHVHRRTAHDTGYCNWPKMSEKMRLAELEEARKEMTERAGGLIQWGFVEPLKDSFLIEAFERQERVRFPEEYRVRVLRFNGAYPSKESFITKNGTITTMKCLLSFNKDSVESIWVLPDYFCADLQRQYVNFADDDNGNHICFDKNDLSVVWIDHETEQIEKVAPDFESFLNMLF